ncbi:MAG: Crp/Fnr family transcriptional regulator [Balneolaceae bacterium]
MFKNSRIKKLKDQANIIFKSEILSRFSPTERIEFLQLCHRRRYNEGEFIYYQGDPGTGMYFIESGCVQLGIPSADPNQHDQIHYRLEAPSSFGALTIGYDLQRLSSAQCITDCVLLGFFNPDFETLKKRNPQIALKLLEAISTIAMKQLEAVSRKLQEVTDQETAFGTQFNTYYGTGEKRSDDAQS